MFWICLIVGVAVFVVLIAVAYLVSGSVGDVSTGGGIDGYPHDNARSPVTDEEITRDQEKRSWHD